MKKAFGYINILIIAFVFISVSLAKEGFKVTESGLMYKDLEVGTGDTAELGKIAVIHFSAWIDDNSTKGEVFFNSRDGGKPISFKVGTERVIKGWNIGVAGMEVGGKRRLMVPANLGYGASGADDVIPPNADLIYDIELIEVK